MSPAHQLSYKLAAATFAKRTSQSITEPVNATDAKTSELTNADRSARFLDSLVEPVFVGNLRVHSSIHGSDEIHGGDGVHGGDEGRPHPVIQISSVSPVSEAGVPKVQQRPSKGLTSWRDCN